ncbi:AraC family transcriptional regulator [Fulvivirga sp. RKSG066]|uniref:helix-turn-helix domain-containing protein n=1 Tax=Fulvivirga aurantia TaxID=2529383 RepID=UPI0012BC37E3|nr:helix-turn-helix domain-containing protein [Fulvivirga aurantia]MTI20791.1 AraC family transcriptional regulator [Fulvivirga aurantia]
MSVEHIIILAICSFGVLHGLSLGISLLVAPQLNTLSNRILGVLLIVFGIRISKSIFLSFTSDLDMLFITLGLTLILSFGPIFYFYTRSFLQENFRINKGDALHFIPFSIFFVLNSLSLLSKDFYLNFGIYFIYLHFLSYIIYSFIWQRRYRAGSSISISRAQKNWLNYIHLGVVFIWFSYFMFLLDEVVPYIMGPITYSLVVYPLSIWAFVHKVLMPKVKKYQNSRLNKDQSVQLISELEKMMKDEKLILNPELKLQEVASHLKVSAHALSQAVNENFEQNFQHYLNSYRIKSAQQMLNSSEYDHLTISSIAYDSGFNSLSAFNAAFKKNLQKTPSQYRKERDE